MTASLRDIGSRWIHAVFLRFYSNYHWMGVPVGILLGPPVARLMAGNLAQDKRCDAR